MRMTSFLTATCLGLAMLAAPARAENAVPTKADVEAMIDEAQTWLLSKQAADGSFGGTDFGLGITGLATEALASGPHGVPASDEHIAKALKLLISNQQPDGGVYTKEAGLGNYCTSLTLMALAASGQSEANKAVVEKGRDYLFKLQRTPKDDKDLKAGGVGYDPEDGPGHEDVPNTVMALQGLKAAGVPASDPHMQAALKFLERCQNLSSVNPAPWVDNDGGKGSAVYSPDESQANGSWETDADKANPTKKLIGTGSMTYSLISAYVILDLKQDDPRVSTALDWCKRNYRFDANPGMISGKEHEGLLYYYMMMGKTMSVCGIKQLELADGKKADWRADLFASIKAHGKEVPVGDKKGMMFMNDAQRWGEAFPHLATAYIIKALKNIDSSL
jgi:squalene-hopene/tetraprenyl-beta-curcumene cyclase